MSPSRHTRRKVIFGTGAALAFGRPACAQPQTVRIAWNPLAGGSAGIVMLMIRDRMFEEEARNLGSSISIEWRAFPSGPPATEALVAGQTDIDLHSGSLPAVSRIAAKVPATPFGVVGSHISNAVMIPPNSPIKEVADLAGKRIALPLGTSAHYLLASIIKIHLGKTLSQAGIRLVNMPAAEAVKIPSGVDAAVVWVPLRFIGPQLGVSKMLVDGDGMLGTGAARPGTRTQEVERSWAFPEGYNTDRLYAFASNDFLTKRPELLKAFLIAHTKAQRRAIEASDELVDLATSRWQQDKIVAKTTLQTYAETAGIRIAPFMLEWDAITLAKASEFLNGIGAQERAVAMSDLAPLLALAADVQRRAWEEMPNRTSVDAMKKGFEGRTELYGPIIVNGGAPIWELGADWGSRFYKPG